MAIHPKAIGGTVGGAFGIVLTWILVQLGLDVTVEVAGAISTICTFALAWLVPSPGGAA
jgi:hypothetical protein